MPPNSSPPKPTCTMPTVVSPYELGPCGQPATRIRPRALGGEPICDACYDRVRRDLETAAHDAARQLGRWLRCVRM